MIVDLKIEERGVEVAAREPIISDRVSAWDVAIIPDDAAQMRLIAQQIEARTYDLVRQDKSKHITELFLMAANLERIANELTTPPSSHPGQNGL